MKYISKNIKIFFSCLLMSLVVFPTTVYGEEDYTDTTYWNSLCTSASLSATDQKRCDAYITYMSSQDSSLKEQIDAINAQKADINANISSYANQLSTYNNQLVDINGMITDLNTQIAYAQQEIVEKQAQIDENQKAIETKTNEIETLRTKIKNRMETNQETMRMNEYLEIVMGASSFQDLIRIANGLSDIMSRDNYDMEELTYNINQLKNMQEELQADQEELTTTQTDLEYGQQVLAQQQTALLASAYQTQLIEEAYSSQLDTANAQYNDVVNSIEVETTPVQEESSADTTIVENTGGSETSGDSSGNPYTGGWGNCTWGAWQLAHDILGVSLPNFGFSGAWVGNAAALGYATGSEPRVNSIVVMPYHVGFVDQVNGDQIHIREGNYLGRYNERWISGTSGIVGYVYI